jgi:hypothetical protein
MGGWNTSLAWPESLASSSRPRSRLPFGSSFCYCVSVPALLVVGALSHTVWHRVGLEKSVMLEQVTEYRLADNSLDLRKLARLLLDTHDDGVVVSIRCRSIDSEARTFWWSRPWLPRVRSEEMASTTEGRLVRKPVACMARNSSAATCGRVN